MCMFTLENQALRIKKRLKRVVKSARGGFTTVCAMPNLNPVPDTAEKLSEGLRLNSKKMQS